VKTPTVHQKLIAVHAQLEQPELLHHSHSLKNLKQIKDVVVVIKDLLEEEPHLKMNKS